MENIPPQDLTEVPELSEGLEQSQLHVVSSQTYTYHTANGDVYVEDSWYDSGLPPLEGFGEVSLEQMAPT